MSVTKPIEQVRSEKLERMKTLIRERAKIRSNKKDSVKEFNGRIEEIDTEISKLALEDESQMQLDIETNGKNPNKPQRAGRPYPLK